MADLSRRFVCPAGPGSVCNGGLTNLASRLTAALAGAGLVLTAAVAFATFVKAIGMGLLGPAGRDGGGIPLANSAAVGVLGSLVLVLAVGMPVWLRALDGVAAGAFGVNAAASMRDGWLLVPLTAKLAFISPSKLIIAMPLLALLPVALLVVSMRRRPRTVLVWYGGRTQNGQRTATTALTFSNALRTFYSFVYRPTVETEREHADQSNGWPYFVRRLMFRHDVAPIFGPLLFVPLERLVVALARRLRIVQSGLLNVYLALIGALLLVILCVALVQR